MENLTTLQIIVKDSIQTSNKNNKNLFKFLNLNIEEILQSNFYIQLILLTKNNYKSFTKKFDNTPALINTSNDDIIVGTYKIINYLIELCEGSPYEESEDNIFSNDITENKSEFKNKNVNSSEFLHDFLLNEALKDDTIEDPLDLNKIKDKENQYKNKQDKQKEINPKLSKNMLNVSRFNNQNQNKSIDNYRHNISNEEKSVLDNYEVTKTKPIANYMSDDKDLQKFWENMEVTE